MGLIVALYLQLMEYAHVLTNILTIPNDKDLVRFTSSTGEQYTIRGYGNSQTLHKQKSISYLCLLS